MRTAEEILKMYPTQKDCYGNVSVDMYDAADAINEARKEALEEAAKSAEASYEIDDDVWDAAVVDETSITNLIKFLK